MRRGRGSAVFHFRGTWERWEGDARMVITCPNEDSKGVCAGDFSVNGVGDASRGD